MRDEDNFKVFLDLFQYERDNCYIDAFIRQETLEADFIKAINNVKPLAESEVFMIQNAGKTNASRRLGAVRDYYDEESIELVQRREKLLIDKFGYSPPEI